MNFRPFLRAATALALLASAAAQAQVQHDGSPARPLRVILVPADGGTEDGTKKDFQPIFSAVSQATGLGFSLKVGQSYAAAVEAMCGGAADIGFYGPVTYLQARARGCAELLALAVRQGESVYYSGIFVRADSGIQTLADLKGRRIALGDINSTSSFAVPVAMMVSAGIDPVKHVQSITLAGSHANVLKALNEGLVDAGGASFDSFERAVNAKAIDPARVRVIAKSAPIPYPPLAIHPKVPAAVKARLRETFDHVHQLPGIQKDQIRGYGGTRVDGYTSKVSEEQMAEAGKLFALLTDERKLDIMKKAGAR